MKNKFILLISSVFFIPVLKPFEILAQSDCPTLTISNGDKVIESYDNSISINDKINISITNTKNRFRISKVKIKLIPKDKTNNIQVKGYASKFSDNPEIEIPVNKLIQPDNQIEKIVLSIQEVTDESTDSQSNCFFYGQEYSFWVE